VTNINDVLDGHVGLEVECVDRLYLNAYVPNLQVSGQVARFVTDHLGLPIPSPAVFEKIGNRFRRQVKAFAAERGIPILHLKKPDRTRFDDRKLDHVRPYLDRAERDGRFGVVAIVAGQEFQWVFSAKNRSSKPGVVSYEFAKEERRVGTYYLSVGGPPVKGGSPGCLLGSVAAPNRSGCQVGAPAAKRGRTSLTPARTGALWRRSRQPSAS